jgi:hypothetical protein
MEHSGIGWIAQHTCVQHIPVSYAFTCVLRIYLCPAHLPASCAYTCVLRIYLCPAHLPVSCAFTCVQHLPVSCIYLCPAHLPVSCSFTCVQHLPVSCSFTCVLHIYLCPACVFVCVCVYVCVLAQFAVCGTERGRSFECMPSTRCNILTSLHNANHARCHRWISTACSFPSKPSMAVLGM